jgi:hypothetical protein
MTKHILLLAASLLPLAHGALVAAQSSEAAPFDNTKFPKRLQRAESFLGIHFDFHAGPDCKEIGKNTTREMIEGILDQVKPDYIQIDCKGHRGLSSYPTKVGNPAPGFVGDPLRLWRQVTAERGVALFMHYSGVWDSEAILQHPDWAALNADGKPNGNATSVFGPYVDQLLVPQLKELAGVYGVDGAWIDGECWATVPDYGEKAVKLFRDQTGFEDIPRKPGDPHWFEWLQFHREGFRKYLRHYIAEMKRTHPQFELCSNWAYTDHMAEPVSAPLDFLSGDYSPEDSVNSARLSARYLVRQGQTWDLMAWSFTRNPSKDGRRQKTAPQLQREAAVVLALGGGFQAYFQQKRDGSIRPEQMPVMAEVAKFCRARQALCHHAEPVPQVALLLSTAGHYRKINGLFNRDLSRVSSALQALLAGQYSVEVLGEHRLTGRMAEYPLIVVPEWEYLEAKFRDDLAAYAKTGGNLLLIGPKTGELFQTELGAARQTTPFATLPQTNNVEATAQPAASVSRLGQGRVAVTHFTFGPGKSRVSLAAGQDLLNKLARELFPRPMVEVTGSSEVDVALNRIRGKLAVSLVNTAGPHQREPILDTILPVGPLTVTVRTDRKPKKVTLEPAGEELAFTYRDGTAKLLVPRVDIHSIVVVE